MVIHAAGESAAGGPPLAAGTFAIALAAPDEATLRAHADRLSALSPTPIHTVIEDCGPYAGQMMAIGLAPAPRSKLRRWISSVPLLK